MFVTGSRRRERPHKVYIFKVYLLYERQVLGYYRAEDSKYGMKVPVHTAQMEFFLTI